MTMVLSPKESNYFSSSPLHRSHSQPKFIAHQATYLESPSKLHASSTASLYASTHASWEDQDDEDQIVLPSYHDVGYYGQIKDLEPPASPWASDSYTVSLTSNSTSTNVSRQESPDPVEHAVDDTLVRTQPFRHVDYLSHSWKEEDIWASWKYIVSQRKAYDNSARLENASWRTWTKLKNKLKTVSPESLNWLKDCDVTWLYGPLLTGSVRSLRMSPSPPASSISKSSSFLSKKPILRKRSMSEIILRRSLSASLLLKQAAVAVRVLSSGLASPGIGEKKRIHFNEQVEQCIALEMKGDDDEEPDSYVVHDSDDSDSDGGAVMMGRTNSKRKLSLMPSRRATPQASFSGDNKTIAMLPSTTLKYGESPETATEHGSDFSNSCKLSPSPPQGTPRPSSPILLGDDFEEDDAHADRQPPSAFANRKDSIPVTQEQFQNLHTSRSVLSLNGDPPGTPLCMFMPYEEDEDEVVSESLFEKVVDTINAARDIAYVIRNLGWRR